jgi:hypothetical protein
MGTTDVGAKWWSSGAAPASANADTIADMRLYVEIGLVPVACDHCDTEVLVKKNSEKHTSVQWTSDASVSCPEIAAKVAAGTPAAQILGCSHLKACIDAAVARGDVTVPRD